MSEEIFEPYKDKSQDARFKILPEEYETIRTRWENGESIKGLGRAYGVNKRTIQLIVKPEKREEMKKQHQENKVWERYYEKDKHKEYMRKYRKKKRELGLRHLITKK